MGQDSDIANSTDVIVKIVVATCIGATFSNVAIIRINTTITDGAVVILVR